MGEKIKRWREAHGLSQRQFAEKAGVSRQWMSNIESGESVNVTVGKLKQISQLTGIPLSELVS